MDDRARLRATFDEDARLYAAARPTYPDALFDDLIALAGIPSGGRVLEIGPGTGQATLPLARRGFRVLGIELGARMARVARENLAAFPAARIWEGPFEEWPVERAAFDAALAATSYHWIAPERGCRQLRAALKPGGAFALISTVHVADAGRDAAFFDDAQRVYERVTPEMATRQDPPDQVALIEACDAFGPVTVRRYPRTIAYDSDGYRRLLLTYSGHRALDPARRAELLDGLTDLIDGRYGGSVMKEYEFVLHVARCA